MLRLPALTPATSNVEITAVLSDHGHKLGRSKTAVALSRSRRPSEMLTFMRAVPRGASAAITVVTETDGTAPTTVTVHDRVTIR